MSSGLASQAVTSQAQSDSRYGRTLAALNAGAVSPKETFANIAITQLIEVYTAEADLARNEAYKSDNLKLQRWAAAVDQFTDDLFLVLEDLAIGFPVTFSIPSQGPLVLSVGGRTVLLTHPRADQQVSYEFRILTEFCLRENCDELTASKTPSQPISVSVIAKSPIWSFTQSGPVCSSIDGDIRVQFPTASNMRLFRDQCRQLLYEVRALELDVRWQKHHGVTIDAQEVEIVQQATDIKHRVKLNTIGDSVFINLPLLYSSPLLVGLIGAWMSDRITTGAEQVLSIDALYINWGNDQ